MRWGLSMALGGELAEPRVAAEVAAAAEEAGWDGVFVWDHLWHRGGVPFADPMITLAAIAVATSAVRIGPLVVPLPRRHPLVVAQQVASLDRLTDGRLTLGVGLGHDNYGEISGSGDPRNVALAADDRARAAVLDAHLGTLLAALEGDVIEGAGGERGAILGGRQPRRVPIWVAGAAGRHAGPRRAVRHGLEGVAVVGGGEPGWQPAQVASVVEAISRAGGQGALMDVALVGSHHPDPAALVAAGASWLIPEIRPGTSAAEARALAADGPPTA